MGAALDCRPVRRREYFLVPRMLLEQLARLPFIKRHRLPHPDVDLHALQADSRRVDLKTAFYALAGEHTDGHAYLEQARAAGAPALFLTDPAQFQAWEQRLAREGGSQPALLLAEPGRVVLAELSRLIYEAPDQRLELLGVTGTNGKATVTFLVAQLLAALGEACGIIGSLGLLLGSAVEATDRTTPEAPQVLDFLARCLRAGARSAAMEVSSIGIHQERTHGLHFRAAAFTNLTQDHLDYHGTMERYREQKERLFLEYAPPAAVLNVDDAAGRLLADKLGRERPEARLLTYGVAGPAQLTAEAVRFSPAGIQGRLRLGDEAHPFSVPLLGTFNLANLLAAAGLLALTGRPLARIAEMAPACRGAPGRFERVPVPGPFTVIVDYAHTPDALENVLRTARTLTQGRLAVLFGCGGERDRGKRPQMGAIAERLADLVVLSNDNPRGEDPVLILRQIRLGMQREPARIEPDRRAAIHWLLEQARPGDLLLIAGKGSETYQEIAGQKLPFDDREVVREWAGAGGT